MTCMAGVKKNSETLVFLRWKFEVGQELFLMQKFI